MPAATPTEEEVLGYFDSLSNWGRWGEDDQLGTLNYLTAEKTQLAAPLVRDGTSISCARTISYELTPDVLFAPPMHLMLESGEGWASGDKVTSRPRPASVDYFGLIFHGYTITHVDSLAHFFWDGKMYNGKPAHLVSTNLGATEGSVEAAKDGITARGALRIQSPGGRRAAGKDRPAHSAQRPGAREPNGRRGHCMPGRLPAPVP